MALARLDAERPVNGATFALVDVLDANQALELANAFAPEHLQLIGGGAEPLASRVRSAGCVFVGADSATAFGDYVAGSNHILPTGGAARFASMLSTRHFSRRMAEVRIDADAATKLARAGVPIARAEGFEWHARSMEARIGDN
jgi:histidinol dehydrogenase